MGHLGNLPAGMAAIPVAYRAFHNLSWRELRRARSMKCARKASRWFRADDYRLWSRRCCTGAVCRDRGLSRERREPPEHKEYGL